MLEEQVLKLLMGIEGLLKRLRTWKKIPAKIIQEENRLYQKLRKLLKKKNREIMRQLRGMDRLPVSDMELKELVFPLADSKEEYANIVFDNTQEALREGKNRVISELKKQGAGKRVRKDVADIDFDTFSEEISKLLKDGVFEASDETMDRLIGDVMENLKDSYEKGYGIDKAAERLKEVFDDMEGYELERVARTEVNSAQNAGAEATEMQLGIQYDMWWTAEDSRVRGLEPDDMADHVSMHGQISSVGKPFSNGLTRPGDRSGEAAETINCRCVLVPFLMPEGYAAPAMDYFYEEDLVKVK